jgi:hypothetical protein
MGKIVKSSVVVLILIFLFSLVTLPSMMVKADSSNCSAINCKLTTTSPKSDTVYVDILPLNFTIEWTAYASVPFLYVNMSYNIDDNPKIPITDGNNPRFNPTSQAGWDHYEYSITPPNQTNTSTEIDISSLTSGAHNLTIYADGLVNLDNLLVPAYSFSSTPIYFSVNNFASPTPSVPELSWLIILPLLLSIFSITVILRHRKTAN